MLFSLTAEYTPQALNAMSENAGEDRQKAVTEVVEAAGGKLVAMYGRVSNGPGVLVVVDMPDPDMAGAMTGVAVAAGAIQNPQLTRLYTMAEMTTIRQKRARLAAVYRPPGRA